MGLVKERGGHLVSPQLKYETPKFSEVLANSGMSSPLLKTFW